MPAPGLHLAALLLPGTGSGACTVGSELLPHRPCQCLSSSRTALTLLGGPAQDGAEQAELALRKLKALMPALPVEQRLLDDGLWRSFASLLRDQHAFR